MRKARVVFRVDAEADELQIYDIDFRGNIYKSLEIDRPSNTCRVNSLSAALAVRAERLQQQRREELLRRVAETEQDYAAGNVRRGSVANLMAELDD